MPKNNFMMHILYFIPHILLIKPCKFILKTVCHFLFSNYFKTGIYDALFALFNSITVELLLRWLVEEYHKD